MSTDTAPRTVQKNFRLPEDLCERVDAAAERLGVNGVDLVKEGLLRVLADREPRLKLLAKASPGKRKRHRRSEEANGGESRHAAAGTAERDKAAASTSPSSPRAAVHLPTVLGTWTGMPTSIMRREIAMGHVTVDGRECRDLDVPAVDRAAVCWNGRPV